MSLFHSGGAMLFLGAACRAFQAPVLFVSWDPVAFCFIVFSCFLFFFQGSEPRGRRTRQRRSRKTQYPELHQDLNPCDLVWLVFPESLENRRPSERAHMKFKISGFDPKRDVKRRKERITEKLRTTGRGLLFSNQGDFFIINENRDGDKLILCGVICVQLQILFCCF